MSKHNYFCSSCHEHTYANYEFGKAPLQRPCGWCDEQTSLKGCVSHNVIAPYTAGLDGNRDFERAQKYYNKREYAVEDQVSKKMTLGEGLSKNG